MDRQRLERNLADVRGRIARAAERAGRTADAVRLVAVTKTVTIEEVRALHDLGVTDFGENRIEPSAEKIHAFTLPARWHMIGSVQRRKVKDVVDLFGSVDSVDRVELAEAFEKRCSEVGKRLPILLEVNVSGEAAKHGFAPEGVESALERMRQMSHLDVQGLMTMAPFVQDEAVLRSVFGGLRRLAERCGLGELSMGMTNDFEIAVEEGATQVRIGSALFADD